MVHGVHVLLSKLHKKLKFSLWAGFLALIVTGVIMFKSFSSGSDLLKVGSVAPSFLAESSTGDTVSLEQFAGKKHVVLVFYPGDGTPLCTSQLCAIRDSWQRLEAAETVVLGINGADKNRHAQFASENKFPFPLLVDSDGTIASAYGCRGVFGIMKRTVYVIDKQGKITWVKRGNPSPSDILSAIGDPT